MSSDSQLLSWASRNIHPPNTFLAVWMSDETELALAAIRASHSAICCGIFNYDPRGAPGNHWVAFRIVKQPQKAGEPAGAYWLDSYGTAPDFDDSILGDNTHFKKFLRDASPSGDVFFSDHDIQALDTSVCGNYSLLACREGLPTRENRYWRQVLDAAPMPPESFAKSRVSPAEQFAARARDAEVKKIVRL